MKNKVLYIIITILLMVIASGATYIVMQSKNNVNETTKNNDKVNDEQDNNKDNKPDESSKPEKITLKEEELEKYLGYIPNGDYLGNDNKFTQGAYNSQNITIKTINKNLLLAKAISINSENYNFNVNKDVLLNNSIMCETSGCIGDNAPTKNYYSLTYINSKLKAMYNYEFPSYKEITKYEDTLNIDGMCYYYSNGNFIMCGGGNSRNVTKASLLDNYEATNEELIVYEITAKFYEQTKDGGTTSLVLEDYYNSKKVEIKENDASKANEYLEQNKQEFTKYKHTFKKNSTGYYWYSTEVVS